MFEIITDFFAKLIENIFTVFDLQLAGLLDDTLYIERLFGTTFDAGVVSAIYSFVYGFALSLLILKFLFKGFKTYILWRDGDADNSPQDMLIGAAEATVVSVCFPFLYDIMTGVTLWFLNGITQHMTLSDTNALVTAIAAIISGGIIFILLLLIYAVMAILLYMKLLMRGVELLILRVALPIGCLGLLDSDSGIFKSFIQTFYKTLFTSVIQLVLLSLSLRLAVGGGSFSAITLAIATLMAAFRTPVLLQNLLIGNAPSGAAMNKIYQSVQMGRIASSLFRR